MLSRRAFVGGLTGLPAIIGEDVAASVNDQPAKSTEPDCPSWLNGFDTAWRFAKLEELGVPRSWWHVHRGLHPFSPERILVVDQRPSVWIHGNLKGRLMEQGYGGRPRFSEEKLDYILRLADALTQYYRVPEYFEDWATRLARTELFGVAMGCLPRAGLVHQFQPVRPWQSVATTNGYVDWWVFLLPQGADFQSFHDVPTHVLFGLVEAARTGPERDLTYMKVVSGLVRTLGDIVSISRLDALSAALRLNRQVATLLRSSG